MARLIESLIYIKTINVDDVNELTKQIIQDNIKDLIMAIKCYIYSENKFHKKVFLTALDQKIHDIMHGFTCWVCKVDYKKKDMSGSSRICKSCMEKIKNKSIKPKGLYQYKIR